MMYNTHKMYHQWHISVHVAFWVLIHYLEVDMDLSNGCQYTHFSVNANDKSLTFCGTHSPWKEVYRTNSVLIQLYLRY